MNTPLLALHQVSFAYPGRPILNRVDFALHAGERVALVGDNGAGKSTLLQLLVGLHPCTTGHITAFGQDRREEKAFRDLRLRVGLLFQDPDDQLFCPTVLEDVAFGPLNQGNSRQQAEAIAQATLATLGIENFAERVTHKLSGGEKRLVSLATVLAMQPEVLLLDEPTSGLDEKSERLLIEHLEGLPQAMLFVSHDRRFVERLATRAILLQQGQLSDALLHSHPHTHTHSHLHIHAPNSAHGTVDEQSPTEHRDHHLAEGEE